MTLLSHFSFAPAGEAVAAGGLGGQPDGASSGDLVERSFQPAVVPHGHHAGKRTCTVFRYRSFARTKLAPIGPCSSCQPFSSVICVACHLAWYVRFCEPKVLLRKRCYYSCTGSWDPLPSIVRAYEKFRGDGEQCSATTTRNDRTETFVDVVAFC